MNAKPKTPKIWMIKQGRPRRVNNCTTAQAWTETLFGSLAPGYYRAFPAYWINRQAFPSTPESFAGFACPFCNHSVRMDQHLAGKSAHLYSCACTALVIEPPYDQLGQCHWIAFAAAQRTAEARRECEGGNSILMGFDHDLENS